MNPADLQHLADEVSLHSRHILAQRFVIQSLWVILTKNGALHLEGVSEPIMLMARAAYGADGSSPNAEVLSIVQDMVGKFNEAAEIIPFPQK